MSNQNQQPQNRPRQPQTPSSGTSGQATIQRYKAVYGATRDHRAAVRAAYGWNVHAMENARAVGNA